MRNEQLHIYLTADEAQRINQGAANAGETVNAFVRRLIFTGLPTALDRRSPGMTLDEQVIEIREDLRKAKARADTAMRKHRAAEALLKHCEENPDPNESVQTRQERKLGAKETELRVKAEAECATRDELWARLETALQASHEQVMADELAQDRRNLSALKAKRKELLVAAEHEKRWGRSAEYELERARDLGERIARVEELDAPPAARVPPPPWAVPNAQAPERMNVAPIPSIALDHGPHQSTAPCEICHGAGTLPGTFGNVRCPMCVEESAQ